MTGRFVVQIKSPEGVFGDAWIDFAGHEDVAGACRDARVETVDNARVRSRVMDTVHAVVIAEFQQGERVR